MEFTIPAPLGAQATIAAQQPVRPAPDPTRVEKAPKTDKARADAHNANDHNNAQVANPGQRRETVEPPPDPNQPVGPPPTFQMNVLEMKRELHQRLAQIEFSRGLEDQSAFQRTDAEPKAPIIPALVSDD